MFAVLSAALILASGIFVSIVSAGSSGPTIAAECTNGTTPANGCTGVVINQAISENLGFAPNKPIYVHHGEWITIKDTSMQTHTFSLVQGSLLPKTVAQVSSCGGSSTTPPSGVCLAVLLAHVPGGVPPANPTPPYPNSCIGFTSPTAFQCVDSGTGLANGSPFPKLDTPFTMTKAGDSIVLFPGESFTVQVTAAAGTVLHFLCVIHPWMQGEIVVTA
jgi:hypothetical protein